MHNSIAHDENDNHRADTFDCLINICLLVHVHFIISKKLQLIVKNLSPHLTVKNNQVIRSFALPDNVAQIALCGQRNRFPLCRGQVQNFTPKQFQIV